MEYLFFELLRVALGTQDSLSRTPSADEWDELLSTAEKQSLMGICFAGVLKLEASMDYSKIGISEQQFVTWMGISARIQEQNEKMNNMCRNLRKRLSADAIDSYLLKGQWVADSYPQNMRSMRQPGDIDLWVMPHEAISGGEVTMPLKQRRKHISAYCSKMLKGYDKQNEGYLHTSFSISEDIEVELHFTPSSFSNPFRNKYLQKWFDAQWGRLHHENGNSELSHSAVEFNLVFLLLHIYRHVIYEGIGMRQIMDYFYVLSSSNALERDVARMALADSRLLPFAGAIMWIIKHVFLIGDTDAEWFLCEPDEKQGRMLLSLIEEGGNFGHYSKFVVTKGNNTPLFRIWRYFKRNAMLFRYYHNEIFWHLVRRVLFIK